MSTLRQRMEELQQRIEERRQQSSGDWPKYIATIREAMFQSVGGTMIGSPTKRWKQLRFHQIQHRLWTDKKRFKVLPAGRRSGKTEIAKRHIVREVVGRPEDSNEWYIASAPTHAQARRIYWDDLKRLSPPSVVRNISEGSGTITYYNGCEIQVMGLDVPERAEGKPLAGIILDEFANMLPRVFPFHIRPALADSGGWAWFPGVPEGRNHYYDLIQDMRDDPEWGVYSWWSEDILPPHEIEAIKRTLDPRTYEQEMRGAFTSHTGRIYYNFNVALHSDLALKYNPNLPLIICFDFNVEPGVAVYIQEQRGKTCVIGEVYIPTDSNTPTVCRKIISDWKHHESDVLLYGDPAGGNRSTQGSDGNDWDIIKAMLRPVFGDRVRDRVASHHPPVRARVNAVNSRLQAVDGTIRFAISPKAIETIRDLEGVSVKEGTDGEIDKDKKKNKNLTHLTDALGYYIAERFPIADLSVISSSYA